MSLDEYRMLMLWEQIYKSLTEYDRRRVGLNEMRRGILGSFL